MKILFIATFPAKHFNLYGKIFLNQSEKILALLNKANEHIIDMEVSIDDLSTLPKQALQNYKYIKLIDYHPLLYNRHLFVEKVKVPDESNLDIAGDVTKQIIRWSYKGMMQLHYLKNLSNIYECITYIDADTLFKTNLEFGDLLKLIPDQSQLISAVFRHDINKYTETGWISWNTKHSAFADWVQKYSEGWDTHIYEELDDYHDCAIFDWTCSKITDANYKNLSGGGDHGFNSGILGKFIDHKKGIRKHLGFSYENIPALNTKIGKLIYKIIFGLYIKLKKIRQ